MAADPFTMVTVGRNRAPFDASQVVPTLLFLMKRARRHFEYAVRRSGQC